jgi:hypothetical protein
MHSLSLCLALSLSRRGLGTAAPSLRPLVLQGVCHRRVPPQRKDAPPCVAKIYGEGNFEIAQNAVGAAPEADAICNGRCRRLKRRALRLAAPSFSGRAPRTSSRTSSPVMPSEGEIAGPPHRQAGSEPGQSDSGGPSLPLTPRPPARSGASFSAVWTDARPAAWPPPSGSSPSAAARGEWSPAPPPPASTSTAGPRFP